MDRLENQEDYEEEVDEGQLFLEIQQELADEQIAEVAPLVIWGDRSNFNINNLLKENIHLS